MQIVQLYMAMGGIPFYLEMVNVGESAAQNINRLCFGAEAALRVEFESLYSSLFKKSEQHEAVITALAQKSGGMNREELIKAAILMSSCACNMSAKSNKHWAYTVCRPILHRGIVLTSKRVRKLTW